MNDFYNIGKDLTDKVYRHRYDRFYPMFLEPLRTQKFNMLEIGINEGGSLETWEQYFPKASIYGVDINSEWESDRCITYKFDQSNPEDLKEIVKTIPKCKFIIDDGSHHPYHQFITFIELFENLLENGGVYIIEDIECNYWKPNSSIYGYKVGYFNLIDYFKNSPDQINSEFSKRKNHLSISTVTFAQNCIIITKQTKEEIELTDRSYRFENQL